MVVWDGPEPGLPPAAVSLLADLMASAATKTQVLVATQSVTLVSQFGPEQVWTVGRVNGQSEFRHGGKQDPGVWLERYGDYDGCGPGELRAGNVLGA